MLTSPANSDNHDTGQDGCQLLLTGTSNHPLFTYVIIKLVSWIQQIKTCSSNVYSARSTESRVTKAVRMSDLQELKWNYSSIYIIPHRETSDKGT